MTYRNPDPSARPPAEPWKLCFIVQCAASEADAKRAEIEAQTGARMSWWSRADAVGGA
jgi:hypothetical protein